MFTWSKLVAADIHLIDSIDHMIVALIFFCDMVLGARWVMPWQTLLAVQICVRLWFKGCLAEEKC